MSDYFDSASEMEYASLGRYCEDTDSASDSSSECSEVSLDEYTSSIDGTRDDSCDSDSDTEVIDDKLVIFNFYKTLSRKLSRTFSVSSLEALVSMQHLMNTYKRVSNGILPTEIDYTEKSNCVAYLQRYAACHTALVFDAVTDIFEAPSSGILSSILNKKSLKVVFLGGGPGNDFVGFLTVLYSHHGRLFDLDVTIVDKMFGWEDVFNETIECLRQGDGGKAGSFFEEVNVMTTFISADLKDSEGWDENLLSKLQNADIVFSVKFLSHIPDGYKLQVLQNVITRMKLESHLIYIDYPYPSGVFASLDNYLRIQYRSWRTKYSLGHKDRDFGYENIGACSAEAKVFIRHENDW